MISPQKDSILRYEDRLPPVPEPITSPTSGCPLSVTCCSQFAIRYPEVGLSEPIRQGGLDW